MNENKIDILDRLSRHVASIGFVADRIEDSQASANLATIEDDLIKTIQILQNMDTL